MQFPTAQDEASEIVAPCLGCCQVAHATTNLKETNRLNTAGRLGRTVVGGGVLDSGVIR